MKYEDLYPGSMLIAPPHMTDIRFAGSVLLVATHNQTEGTIALCVNHETSFTVNDLVDEIGIEANLPFPVYWGGPVASGSIWMLHTTDWMSQRSILINEQWAMTSTRTMFEFLAAGDTPREFRIMHGFASWAPGQLKGELEGKHPWTPGSSWLIAPDQGPEWLFSQADDHMWDTCTRLATEETINEWI